MNSSCKKTGNVKENMKNTSERYHRRRWKESILLIPNLGFVPASASWHRKARLRHIARVPLLPLIEIIAGKST